MKLSSLVLLELVEKGITIKNYSCMQVWSNYKIIGRMSRSNELENRMTWGSFYRKESTKAINELLSLVPTVYYG